MILTLLATLRVYSSPAMFTPRLGLGSTLRIGASRSAGGKIGRVLKPATHLHLVPRLCDISTPHFASPARRIVKYKEQLFCLYRLYIVTILSDSRLGFGLEIGFIDHFNPRFVTTFIYRTIAISTLYKSLQYTSKLFSLLSSHFLVTASNTAPTKSSLHRLPAEY
jgi:hypothetical protein